ncbi:MAG TPA: hydrogenase maturation protease [Solirubrobacteraceae bacterium]|nr:hydrogenase maturation protease [Solirubrobacteraceae bacterium]
MILIGVGNGWRGDDGAGLALARRVRELAPSGVEVREVEGDATALMDAWSGAEHVVVVDAAQSEAAPGTVRRFDAGAAALPVRALRSSTHAFGVSDAVELARALGRLPDRLEVYAIEGASFTAGERLSPAVERAVAELASELSASRR